MSTPDDQSRLVENLLHRIEEYRTTLHALLCLLGVVTWDTAARSKFSDASTSLGRRMRTSPSNPVNPSGSVTPDAVAQIGDRAAYVVEAKKSLPRDKELWLDDVTQLQKYDDDLSGWWSADSKVPSHDIVLLLEIGRSADFRNLLQFLISDGRLNFTRPTCLVEFTPSPNGKLFLFLRKLWGVISDPAVSAQLESGTKVPVEDVIRDSGNKMYYDARPVTEYTMEILWQHVFTPLKDTVPYDSRSKAWPIPVSVPELTHELQLLCGSEGGEPGDVQYPAREWIEEAMDAFVSLKLATPSSTDSSYVVLFKRIRGDLIDNFSRHRSTGIEDNGDTHPAQLRLI